MTLGGLEGAYVKYWDEGSMITVLEFEVEQSTKTGQEQANKEKKEKKKKGQPSVGGVLVFWCLQQRQRQPKTHLKKLPSCLYRTNLSP